ncbi:MAG: transcription termination/antitermination protein NusA [Ruminococcaceae bacterium]|nr:transcription termination/antitermination protein NusA [Oscillospiraceae bacterium]
MNTEFLTALNEIEKEKNISKDILLDAIDAALVSAYKRNYNTNQNNVVVNIDRDTGSVKVFICKEVVETVEDTLCQISLDDAKAISGTYEIGDVVNIEDTPAAFGRIAAQTAKQVVLQRIKEAERNLIYDEFSEKEHKVVIGTIQRIEKRNIYLDIGKTEAYLAPGEQVPGENYDFHRRLKVYVTEVKKTTKGPVVNVSRTRPALVAKLFAEEIPEIADGIVEVKSVSREAGSRTKIAVWSNDKNVDAIGACIGAKGTRVQNIVDELGGEKIDIVRYSEDPGEFIRASLNPAEVVSLEVNPEEKEAHVVVPHTQLSLAIGKEGQNARLAARLTGYKIDIKSDAE